MNLPEDDRIAPPDRGDSGLPELAGPPEPAAETIHWVEVYDRRVGLRPGRNVVGRSPDAPLLAVLP